MSFEKQYMYPFALDTMNQQILSQSPLHFACYAGDYELIDILLSKTQNNNNETTDSRLVAMVAEEDAVNGWTPAHWAAFYGQLNCLMKLHVRPDVGFDTPTSKSHISPLHLAAQSGDILCLKWLLHCGASINRQDFMGETPLHKAAKAGNLESATMLIAHGATLDLKNQQGHTPADLAELRNHPAVMWFLRRIRQSQTNNGAQSKSHFPLPVADPSLISSFSGCQPLPTSHCLKDDRFPHVDSHMGKPLLRPINKKDSYIMMNGVSIGSMQHSIQEESDTDISESISSSSVQSDMDTLPSHCGSKRSLGRMEESHSHCEEADSGVSETSSLSPKRRCFGFRNETDSYSDACNNNVPSCVPSFGKSFSSSYHTGAPNMMYHNRPQNSSPLCIFSSEMEHEETVLAEQGYDSSMVNAMQDILS